MNSKVYHGGGSGKGTWPDTTAGTVTGAANVGTGLGKVWKNLVAGILNFKSIKAGTNITVTDGVDDVTLDCPAPGQSNTGSNLGSGDGSVFSSKVGVDLQFRRLQAGSGRILIRSGIPTNSYVDFDTWMQNIGAGTGQIFKTYSGYIAQLKSLIAGTGISITNGTDDITITCTITPGESNTAANVGTGTGLVFRDKTGVTLNLKTIKQGTNLTVVNNADDITLSGPVPGEVNTASNLGAGAQVFESKVLADLRFRSLVNGTGISAVQGANDITIHCTDAASNVGAGAGVFKVKNLNNFNFKSLLAGSNITITPGTDDITIAATGGGVPSWNSIAFVASSQNSGVATNSLTLTKPVGTADGDLILVIIATQSSNTIYVNSPPSDFIRLTCSPIATEYSTLEVWAKYAGGAEPANYTFGWSGSATLMGAILSYRNCMVANKWVLSNSGITDLAFANNITPPACTVVYPNSVSVVATHNEGNGSWTSVPAGYTSRESQNNLRVSDIAIANTGISTPGNCTMNDTKQRIAVNIILVRKYAYLDSMPTRIFIPASVMANDTVGMTKANQTINFRTLECWGMRQNQGDKVTANVPLPFDWDGNYLGVRLLWTSQNATGYNLVKFQTLAFNCGQNESIGEAGGTYYNNYSDYGPTTIQLLRKTPELWIPVQNATTVLSPGGERSYFISIARQPDGYSQTVYLIGAYVTFIRKMLNTLSPTPFNT